MKFKDLVDKYKSGTITEEEKIIVEEELEKFEVIEEYFNEKLDIDFNFGEEGQDRIEDSINLKKNVNNRLRKATLKSFIMITIAIVALFFILSPIVNSFYYNPGKVASGMIDSNIDFDLEVLTDLNLPGYKLASNVNIEKLGFGVYDISFFRRNTFTEEKNNIAIKIKRDKLSETSQSSFTEMYINFMNIRDQDRISNSEIIEQKARVTSYMKKLSPVAYTSSYLTFQEDLTMDELRDIQFKYSDVNFIWAGIRTSNPNEPVYDITGFSLDFGNDRRPINNPDEERYPAFNFLEWVASKSGISSNTSMWAKGYEIHYKTILKYMIDRKEATDVLFYNNLNTEFYQSSLDYVEENGVKTFGVLVYANAEDIIELIENEMIKTVELDQVMASKRYIH